MLFLLDMLVCKEFRIITSRHLTLDFSCHTDAGKSTIGGQIMSLTGMVDKRTLEKYEREAREKSRESWYLSWALDTNQEGKLRNCLIYLYLLKLICCTFF